jgi:hypothetical protein
VRALNFLFADSVEFRVREVLEGKLAVILQEFGVDKTADVLDSGQAGRVFDELYVETILHPEELARRVEAAAQTLRGEAAELKSKKDILGSTEGLIAADDAMQRSVRLWVEQMALSHVEAFGGHYVRELGHCTITWPGERQAEAYSFESTKFASGDQAIEHLRLGHPKITELLEHLPRFLPGMPVPQVKFKSPGSTLDGWWSLWEKEIRFPYASGIDATKLCRSNTPSKWVFERVGYERTTTTTTWCRSCSPVAVGLCKPSFKVGPVECVLVTAVVVAKIYFDNHPDSARCNFRRH